MKEEYKQDLSVLYGFLAVAAIAGILVLGNNVYQRFQNPEARSGRENNVSYPEAINGIETKELISAARAYIATEPRVFFNDSRWVKWDDKEALGIVLDKNIFLSSNPISVEYNPLEKYDKPYRHLNNKFVVSWNFGEGPFGESHVLNVLIDSGLKAEQVLLDSLWQERSKN